jgi:putative hydrolase of HD superfamily
MTRAGDDDGLAYLRRMYRLKTTPREGWVRLGVADPESVADHTWGTAALCMAFADAAGVDAGEALEIAVAHDLAESVTGDVATSDVGLDAAARARRDAAKAEAETAAMTHLETLPGDLPSVAARARIRARWAAYEARASEAARFVRDMNLVDMALQARLYAEAVEAGADDAGGVRRRVSAPFDEFLASAEARASTDVGRALLARVREGA